MMKNIMRRAKREQIENLDVVLIGHSKTFVPYNEKTLRPFLQWLEQHPSRRAIKMAIATAMRVGAEGIKVQVCGRLGGA